MLDASRKSFAAFEYFAWEGCPARHRPLRTVDPEKMSFSLGPELDGEGAFIGIERNPPWAIGTGEGNPTAFTRDLVSDVDFGRHAPVVSY